MGTFAIACSSYPVILVQEVERSLSPNFSTINGGIPMKNILLVSILVFCSFIGPAQADERSDALIESNLKVKELASIPVGLSVTLTIPGTEIVVKQMRDLWIVKE